MYSENGEVRGYLVEQHVAQLDLTPQRMPASRRGPPPSGRNVYTTIMEEDEEEEEA